jgi:enamine deaminase RidA (YjgF/YER057c/UK114 family)
MPVTNYLKPETLYRPRGFAHVTVATGTRLVSIGGQISSDLDGKLVHPGDYQAQARLTTENFIKAVKGSGASVADVAKLGIYVVDLSPENEEQVFAGFGEAAKEHGLRVPAMYVLGISALAAEGALIEIDGIAYF